MPDHRTHQAVAERLELQLSRYPNRLHRYRRWFTIASGILPLLFVGYFVGRGDHTVFLSEPVALSHQHFQADCQTCHHTPWQPVVRLASTDPNATSVHDQTCHQCHDQRKDDHHTLAMAKGVPDCADCHLEHRGATRLTNGADAACVKCHAPFEEHPQFSLLRLWPLEQQPTTRTEALVKELTNIAQLQPIEGDASSASGHWRDKTALKFSHVGHLAPLAARWKPGADSTAPAELTQLNCADCHQPDANGWNMQPIVFEKHCQECHPLRYSGTLDVDNSLALSEHRHDLPHASPEIVRGAMRERLIAYARRHPDEVVQPASRLPNRTGAGTPTPKQEWDWVEEQLGALEDAIFRTSPAKGTTQPGNACLKCHETDDASPDAALGLSIRPPNIPTRWMPHSLFRHDRHLHTDCVRCHQANASSTVEDILLPSKHICQTCHGATQGELPLVRRARKNCTECHQYHHVRHLHAHGAKANP